MVGAVGETASMKRRKLWKTGEDGLCCSSSAIQTRLDPSSLLEERSETPIVFVCFFCVVGYPPIWGKRPRYIDRIGREVFLIRDILVLRYCIWLSLSVSSPVSSVPYAVLLTSFRLSYCVGIETD